MMAEDLFTKRNAKAPILQIFSPAFWPKTRFGKCIHDVLAYYISLVNFEHKKVTDCSFNISELVTVLLFIQSIDAKLTSIRE